MDGTKNVSSEVAMEQFAMKLKLEKSLRRDMAKYFREIAILNNAYYIQTGDVMNINVFRGDLYHTLLAHNKKVGRFISNNLRRQLNKKAIIFFESKGVDEKITLTLTEQYRQWAIKSSEQIGLTTQRYLNDMYLEEETARLLDLLRNPNPAAELTPVVRGEISLNAIRAFNKKSKSRLTTIAITETQRAFEGTKQIEAAAIAEEASVLSGVPEKEIITSEWVAVLDQNTREAHVIADGQRRPIGEPFDVDGEQLMFPADDSLGASKGNIINCRCIAAQIVNNAPILEAIDNAISPDNFTGSTTQTVDRENPLGVILQSGGKT